MSDEQQGANGAAEPTAQEQPKLTPQEMFAARMQQNEEAPDTTEETATASEDRVEEVVEEVTQSQTEDESVSEQTSESAQSVESTTEEPEPWESLEELLEAASATRDGVPVRIKVNGEEIETTLDEALSGYQRDADYRRKTQALADERRTFETERKEKLLMLDQQLEASSKLIESQEQLVINRYRQYDWNKLQSDNPAAYAQLESELRNELQLIDNAKKEVTNSVARAREQLITENKAELTKQMAQRDEFLANAVSKWDVEQPKVTNYLKEEHGVKDHELESLVDSRVWVIAHKAYLYDLQQEAVKNAPQTLTKGKKRTVVKQSARKRGATEDSATVTKQKEERARTRLRRSGKQKDAVDAFRQRIDAIQGEA